MKLFTTLILLLLIAACGPSRPTGPMQGSELMTYMPKNTAMLVYANIQEIKDSPFIDAELKDRMDMADADARRQLDKFIELTGLDPRTDIHEVMVSAVPAKNEMEPYVVAVKGNFNEAKLIAVAKQKIAENDTIRERLTMSEADHNGQKIYTFTMKRDFERYTKDEQTKTVEIAFVKGIMLMTDSHMNTILDQGESIKDNPGMMASLNWVGHHSMYVTGNLKTLDMSNVPDNPYQKQIDLIDEVGMSFSAKEKLSMTMVAVTSKTDRAQDIEDVIRGLIATARLAVSEERDLVDLMNEIEIDRENGQIYVHWEIDQERFERLKKYRNDIQSKI